MAIEKLKEKLTVSESPHIRSGQTTQGIMLDVVIALIPALIAGVLIFGYRAAVLAAVCVSASVIFEWLWCKIVKKPSSVGDFSAVVTGLLLALNLPVTMPFWMAIIGALFAIVVVKQFFGGVGHNFMNPALAARAFLLTSWAQPMTTWVAPFSKVSLFGNADAVSMATPLSIIKEGGGELPSYMDMFLGKIGGCVGEVSTLALLLGAIYLLAKRVIDLKIPASYILTTAVMVFVFGGDEGLFSGDVLRHLLSGGLVLAAFFMATDYVTTPYTPKGQIIFGIGCGLLTSIIRLWGGYPEGASYSILLMNVMAPLIDRFTVPKKFGFVYSAKGGKKDA
ncbi:MAG: RnfABCDGE type electron transport complex subunit D [Clostridia bacterium]|nr:RnfABCDGE type electron transport complex subunit D [Clostridia bacterium]